MHLPPLLLLVVALLHDVLFCVFYVQLKGWRMRFFERTVGFSDKKIQGRLSGTFHQISLSFVTFFFILDQTQWFPGALTHCSNSVWQWDESVVASSIFIEFQQLTTSWKAQNSAMTTFPVNFLLSLSTQFVVQMQTHNELEFGRPRVLPGLNRHFSYLHCSYFWSTKFIYRWKALTTGTNQLPSPLKAWCQSEHLECLSCTRTPFWSCCDSSFQLMSSLLGCSLQDFVEIFESRCEIILEMFFFEIGAEQRLALKFVLENSASGNQGAHATQAWGSSGKGWILI